MIEKIRRPQQYKNQEMQIPRNIQELMQRYDLDNNDIKDYLDLLITQVAYQKDVNEIKATVNENAEEISIKIPTGGKTGQVLAKKSDTDNQWVDNDVVNYFNGTTTSINDLNTNGKWRGYIPANGDDYNYLGFSGNVIVETFVQNPCMQRITQMATGNTYIRFCASNALSYSDKLIPIATDSGWISIDNAYGTLEYRKEGRKCYLRGSFTGISSSVAITLPFTCTKQYVFLLGGNSLFYTKAYINANTNVLGIVAGTGTSSSTYNLNASIYID